MPTTANRSDGGFTLIELLVALSLLSMILVLLLAGIRSSQEILRQVETMEQQAQVPAVQNLLRKLIAGARPTIGTDDTAEVRDVIVGARQTLEFISGYSPPGRVGGIYLTKLGVAQDAQGSNLLTLWIVQELLRKANDPDIRIELLTGLASADFRYFGSENDNVGQSWREQWTSKDRLPRLIEIVVRFPKGDPRAWPRLVVELPLAN